MNKYVISTRTKQVHPYYGNHEIGESFTNIGGDEHLVITPEQATAFTKVVAHQGEAALKNIFMPSFDKYLGLQFDHILIGIEPDGYAHS